MSNYNHNGNVNTPSVLAGRKSSLPSIRHLHKIFEKKCASGDVGNRPALIYNDELTSLSTLNQTANQMARMLVKKAKQIQPFRPNMDNDYLIAVSMAPSDKLITTLLAIWKMGAAYVPIDPTFPENRIVHIIKDCEPLFVISDHNLENKEREIFQKYLPTYTYSHLISDAYNMAITDLKMEEMLPVPLDTEAGNRIGIVLYTSGSTGIPKGVRLPHRVILNRLMWQWRTFPYNSTDILCFKTALTFVDSVSEIFGPLLKGLPVVIVSKATTQNPQELLELLEQWKISRIVLVPSLLRSLFWAIDLRDHGKEPLPDLRLWVCSGETFPVDLLDLFFKYFPQGHGICNFYGSTEVMGDVTYEVYTVPEDIDSSVTDGKVPIGKCVDNTAIYILNGDTMRPTNKGEVGEIFVAGFNLAAGYVGVKNSDKFLPSPLIEEDYEVLYRTGDFGRIVKQRLIYEGRSDSQIKVRGHRVDLAEVERALQNHYAVDKAVVICYKHGLPEQCVLAYFTAASGNLTEAQALVTLKEQLPTYMAPDHVFCLDSIPLLHNGKTDRQTLLKKFEEENNKGLSQSEAKIDYSSVPKDLEEYGFILLETIAAILGPAVKQHLSLRSTFFEVGGNSLNSVLMVTRLRDQGFPISVAEFIGAKSLEDVARRMQSCVSDDQQENAHSSGEDMNSSGSDEDESSHLSSEMLQHKHRHDVTRIISGSFSRKGDLEKWTKGTYDDFTNLIDQVWDPLIEKQFSFVVKNRNGKVIGVALNFDVYDEPPASPAKPIEYVFDFLEFMEGAQRKKLPQGKGKLLHSFMMGTDLELGFRENIYVIKFMEDENMRLAKMRNMVGVMTTNTSALTQQICEDLLGYEVLFSYQVNRYLAPDGTKPFEEAPDSQIAVCSWRKIPNDKIHYV